MSTYIEKCMVPKRGHVGMFPANFCTKIIGRNGKWNTNLLLDDIKCIYSHVGDIGSNIIYKYLYYNWLYINILNTFIEYLGTYWK